MQRIESGTHGRNQPRVLATDLPGIPTTFSPVRPVAYYHRLAFDEELMDIDWGTISLTSLGSVLLNAIVLGFWKPWAAAYSGEKGKNLARKEDITTILAEVRAVTIAQKEIESKLTGDLWYRQMRWNQKRDTYIELIKHVNDLMAGYYHLAALIKGGAEEKTKFEHWDSLKSAHVEFTRLTRVAQIFTNKQSVEAANAFMMIFRDSGGVATLEKLTLWQREVSNLLETLVKAAKEDLVI